MGKIQIKRGNNANFNTVTLESGELALILDTGKLFAGNGTTKVLINPDAPVTSVAGKTGIITLAKSDVGLSNVDNESKTTMFSNPAFTGSPTAPTQIATDSSTKIATTAFVKSQNYLSSNADIDGGVF